MANRTQLPSERAPLLQDATNNHADNNGRNAATEDDLDQLSSQFKTWRRRRWVSLIVSAFLIVAFIAILILSGRKCYPLDIAIISSCARRSWTGWLRVVCFSGRTGHSTSSIHQGLTWCYYCFISLPAYCIYCQFSARLDGSNSLVQSAE